jgi:hypothetical protein
MTVHVIKSMEVTSGDSHPTSMVICFSTFHSATNVTQAKYNHDHNVRPLRVSTYPQCGLTLGSLKSCPVCQTHC